MKRLIAWLVVPFATAASFDCGVSFAVCASIEIIWIISAFAWLEFYKRKEEQKEQRRLSECREKLTQSESK